jgi:amidophosphoribosyltransferase
MEGLVKAIGLPKNELCIGCLTGKYPTPKANELIQIAAKQKENGIRVYEQVHNPKEYNQ